MSHYSNQSDPDDNPQFRRDWGDGPVYINFCSKKAKPTRPIPKTKGAKAAEPKAAA